MIITSGIFIFNNKNELLICHPTGHQMSLWSIPKGQVNVNEELIDAAIRETMEESNIDLSDKKKDLIYIGEQKYASKTAKIIHGFVYKFEEEINFDLKCTSIITGNYNFGKPENDIVKFESIEKALELLHESQSKLLKRYLKI